MQEMIIWGAGRKGRTVARRLRNAAVKYFIDSDAEKAGKYLCGHVIRPVEELYKERGNVLLVKTVADEMVDSVLENWTGKSIAVEELLCLSEIMDLMDEDLYAKYKFDKSLVECLFTEEPFNWFRRDYWDETNRRIIFAMRKDDHQALKDIFAGIYTVEKLFDEYYAVRPGMRLIHRIIGQMEKNCRVVDLACGHGDLITRLSEEKYQTWASDYNEERVASLLGKGIRVSLENVEHTNYKDGFFDAVICMECLEHVGNVLRAVSEIARITAKDGIIFITVPYMKNCDCTTHVRQFDEVKLASLFSKDFEIINIIRIPYLNWTDDDSLFLAARKK